MVHRQVLSEEPNPMLVEEKAEQMLNAVARVVNEKTLKHLLVGLSLIVSI